VATLLPEHGVLVRRGANHLAQQHTHITRLQQTQHGHIRKVHQHLLRTRQRLQQRRHALLNQKPRIIAHHRHHFTHHLTRISTQLRSRILNLQAHISNTVASTEQTRSARDRGDPAWEGTDTTQKRPAFQLTSPHIPEQKREERCKVAIDPESAHISVGHVSTGRIRPKSPAHSPPTAPLPSAATKHSNLPK